MKRKFGYDMCYCKNCKENISSSTFYYHKSVCIKKVEKTDNQEEIGPSFEYNNDSNNSHFENKEFQEDNHELKKDEKKDIEEKVCSDIKITVFNSNDKKPQSNLNKILSELIESNNLKNEVKWINSVIRPLVNNYIIPNLIENSMGKENFIKENYNIDKIEDKSDFINKIVIDEITIEVIDFLKILNLKIDKNIYEFMKNYKKKSSFTGLYTDYKDGILYRNNKIFNEEEK
jgi:hypothetical protein